ncbi:MAG: phosphodiester glycosidase family protein [Armatimonadetes bacterium]|nr:phosphodiester glycosidase family protein [Armatimonadota bacterium]
MFLTALSATHSRPESVGYSYVKGPVPLHVVTVNLEDPDIKLSVALPWGGVGTSESFRGILRRSHPAAAITGTFFGERSLQPVGDIVIDGSLRCTGFIGIGVCWTTDNRIDFIDTRKGQPRDWDLYEGVLCGGPRLLRDGKIALAPKAEGYRDKRLYRPALRSALALTGSGKLLLATSTRRIYYRQMAAALRRLGAVEAVGLDGGTSTGLFYRGKFLSRPNRKLTNILVIFDNQYHYDQVKGGLVPNG